VPRDEPAAPSTPPAPTAPQPPVPPAPSSWPPQPQSPVPAQQAPTQPTQQQAPITQPQPATPSAWPTAPPSAAFGGATPPVAPPGGGWGYPGQPASPAPESGWPSNAPSTSTGKRVLAAIAALALVLFSAGVGAAVATAMHKDSTQNASSTFPNLPGFGNNGNGSGNGNPFGNGSNGSGSNGSGSSSTGSGSLNANAIASQVTPSIVNVNTTLAQGRAAGTGIIISSSGLMVTNNHVIADSTSIKVDIGGTGNTHSAHVLGYDVADDVALVQIEGVSNLKVAQLGDPSQVNVGDPVVAIGNALGKGGSPAVTQGKVTALNQDVTAGDASGGTTETLHNMIQIDAPIQPGDSGGALVNADGKIIGINTAAAGGRFRQQSGSNVGFAIPITNAISITDQIQKGDESNGVHIGARALLGVSVKDANDPTSGVQSPVSSGAAVVTVQSGSAAAAAGIQVGDVVTAIDGNAIQDQNGLHLSLTKYHPGDKVSVEWVDSGGQQHTASVQLGEGPPA
jgi:S1-C subfamily serine protease